MLKFIYFLLTETNRLESTTEITTTEEAIYMTTDGYITTTSASNAEKSSTVDEETTTKISTTSFGIATITDILSISSTGLAANAETKYTTDISATDYIEHFTDTNHVETTTTAKTDEDVDPTTTDATALITQFGTTSESFGFPTYAANIAYISNYSTSGSVTGT